MRSLLPRVISIVVLLMALSVPLAAESPAFYSPVLGNVPWPMLHQNGQGTKSLFANGPISGARQDGYEGRSPVIFLLGKRYMYYQPSALPLWYLMDPQNLARGPIRSFNTDVIFPFAGGGNIDQYDNFWITGNKVLIRTDEQLSNPVYSESLVSQIPLNETPPQLFNALNFLPSSTILVSAQGYFFLVGAQPAKGGKFPLLETIKKTEFVDEHGPIFSSDSVLSTRPIEDGGGDIYLLGADAMSRVRFDPVRRTLQRRVVWSFRNPLPSGQSDMGNATPVVINRWLCVATKPLVPEVFQTIYCVNRETGVLERVFQPFSTPGISSDHTLGAIPSRNWIFAIASAAQGGGVAGFNVATGERLWPSIDFMNISQQMVLASGNQQMYVTATNRTSGAFEAYRIDLATAAVSTLRTFPVPGQSMLALGAMDNRGSVFLPHPSGLAAFED